MGLHIAKTSDGPSHLAVLLHYVHKYTFARTSSLFGQSACISAVEHAVYTQQRTVSAPSVDQTSSMRQMTSLHCRWAKHSTQLLTPAVART